MDRLVELILAFGFLTFGVSTLVLGVLVFVWMARAEFTWGEIGRTFSLLEAGDFAGRPDKERAAIRVKRTVLLWGGFYLSLLMLQSLASLLGANG